MDSKSDNQLKLSLSTEELISNGAVYINKFKEIQDNDFTSLRKLQLEFMTKFFEKYNNDFYDGFVIFHRTITGYYPVKVAEEFIDYLKTYEYSEAVKKTSVLIKELMSKES